MHLQCDYNEIVKLAEHTAKYIIEERRRILTLVLNNTCLDVWTNKTNLAGFINLVEIKLTKKGLEFRSLSSLFPENGNDYRVFTSIIRDNLKNCSDINILN